MIKKGIEQSDFINEGVEGEKVTHILKITGRYPMLNLQTISNEVFKRLISKNKKFMGDIKDTKLYELVGHDTLSSHWGDSRFWAAEVNFYRQNIADCYLEMNDYKEDSWAEHYFLNLSRKYRRDPRFIWRFKNQVHFGGVSGVTTSEGLKNDLGVHNSPVIRRKIILRNIVRKVLPWLWI